MIGLSAVFYAVRAVFLVILGSKAAEGAFFSSLATLGTGVRLDLRKIMVKDRSYGVILLPKQTNQVAKPIKSAKVLAR